MAKGLFGAGCFWGVQEKFHHLQGVNSTCVGYAGGNTQHPTYKEVCSGFNQSCGSLFSGF